MNNVSVLIIRTKKSLFQDGVRERYVSMIRYYFTQNIVFKSFLQAHTFTSRSMPLC